MLLLQIILVVNGCRDNSRAELRNQKTNQKQDVALDDSIDLEVLPLSLIPDLEYVYDTLISLDIIKSLFKDSVPPYDTILIMVTNGRWIADSLYRFPVDTLKAGIFGAKRGVQYPKIIYGLSYVIEDDTIIIHKY